MQTKNYCPLLFAAFKNLALILFFVGTSTATTKAQSKLGGLLYKAAVINSQVKSATSIADTAKSSGLKIGNFFKKNKKNSDKETPSKSDTVTVAVTNKITPDVIVTTCNKTIITVTGIDFSTLQILNESIKACDGVKNTAIKFTFNSSVIAVEHVGTSGDLLSLLQKTSKPVITSKNVQGFEEGKIDVKL